MDVSPARESSIERAAEPPRADQKGATVDTPSEPTPAVAGDDVNGNDTRRQGSQEARAEAAAHSEETSAKSEGKRGRESDLSSDESNDRKRRKDADEAAPRTEAPPEARKAQDDSATLNKEAGDESRPEQVGKESPAERATPAAESQASGGESNEQLANQSDGRLQGQHENEPANGVDKAGEQSEGAAAATKPANVPVSNENASRQTSKEPSEVARAKAVGPASKRADQSAEVLAESKAPEQVPHQKSPGNIRIDSSAVIQSVAELERRSLGSAIYEPGKILVRGHELDLNCVLQVRVGHEYLSRDAPSLKRRELWGTQVYTDDSDLVAVLAHEGLLPNDASAKCDLNVDILLLPVLEKYVGSYRHGLNSREWRTRHDGISYMVLGKPRSMPAGWSFSGVEQQMDRIKLLAEARNWKPVELAYADRV